ncbi:MAG: formylglycine-generating enzyme family protein [Gammaproteobacteria bacterium]|nr:formylglycine-generating enzyme family protein [Chromatiales bacterium]MYE49242.1 formylglycine-generating enzyme family protein [Gammaproteobacteria bacterium]
MKQARSILCAVSAALFLVPAAAAEEQSPRRDAPQAGESFSDPLSSGGLGPEMVVIPAGGFSMGCVSGLDCYDDEKPVHQVTISEPFAVSKYEITFEDYDRFSGPGTTDDQGWGRGRLPVLKVSWNDAKEYVAWLSAQSGRPYRLLSEAEWEYAARAGSATKYAWGNSIEDNRANCYGCGSQWDYEQAAPVGSFEPNAFGLHDVHGNVYEWVEDCWNGSYEGAPADGSAWLSGDCGRRIVRGGAWDDFPDDLRIALRVSAAPDRRDSYYGFRVARRLGP